MDLDLVLVVDLRGLIKDQEWRRKWRCQSVVVVVSVEICCAGEEIVVYENDKGCN